jgi:hypothetical protein
VTVDEAVGSSGSVIDSSSPESSSDQNESMESSDEDDSYPDPVVDSAAEVWELTVDDRGRVAVGERRCLAVSADVGAVGIAADVGVGVEVIVGVGLVESISRVGLAESWPTISAPIQPYCQ